MSEEGPGWSRYYAVNLTVPQEAISDHYTGSLFKYINMVLIPERLQYVFNIL